MFGVFGGMGDFGFCRWVGILGMVIWGFVVSSLDFPVVFSGVWGGRLGLVFGGFGLLIWGCSLFVLRCFVLLLGYLLLVCL